MELKESLLKCSVKGNVLFLPTEQLTNYAQVRKALLNAGAKYVRNTFVFPSDAQPYIDRLTGGESVNIKKEFQFFPTPANIADDMVQEAFRGRADGSVLEPSAGQGAILEAINRYSFSAFPTDCFELMDINREVIQQKINNHAFRAIILGNDFLLYDGGIKWDTIIANPPFTKNQDIDHIKKMYSHLKNGGRLVTLASKSWQQGSTKKQVEFREWLNGLDYDIIEIEAGAFKESGTQIATLMLIINK